MFRRNIEIREIKGNIPMWIIAERLGIHENTLHNWLKKELGDKRKQEILVVIEQIKKEISERR